MKTDNEAWLADVTTIQSSAPATTTYTEPTETEPTTKPDGGAKRALAWFAAATIVAAVLVVATSRLFTTKPADQPDEPAAPATVAHEQTTPTQPTQTDTIGYTATDHCPAGSTQPQLLADNTTDSWWICVRGTTDARVDGQIIHIDFGKPYVVTSVQIVAGAAPQTRGGKDEWDRHRVIHMLQYNFRNGDTVTPVIQDTTGGTGPVPKGPVSKQLDAPVLASSVDVIIQQTDRPATTPTTTTELLETPPTTTTAEDPVDYTVAAASLKFFGYPPTSR